mmetsp:Transcript_46535/g.86451  ORF Transcript_46535/g.86451 Transcript_46535/m.86451 type:complete len:90 (-) Transcript_46535:118-387(-)|eukprot:CAMPEP_0197450756 /NCGR_PEP_ID=MMETSP1175-20131217/26428_1 /TAXON_ID=1003142 /ORGANISM="Triceratium dubium, Strain CCMP147" /LENGTH=89 /DNA_ID=CAMNT_0042983247 /DNA_START=447 /DNA_END=716 /DNA_ORIENTATION=-
MSWSFNRNGVTPNRPLKDAEQKKLNIFMNSVGLGKDPRDAAKEAGAEFKQLKGTNVSQYEIYLSRENRATFLVDWNGKSVEMIQVGGHT